MSKWKKSSPALIARWEASLPPSPAIERRQMFGYPVAFANGYFFTGLFQEDVLVRLPAEQKARFADLAKATVFNPMGRGKGMTNFWVLPPGVSASASKLSKLLGLLLPEVLALPPKKPKAKKAPKRQRARL